MPMLCLPETVATRSYMDAAPRKRLMLRTGAATSCGGASAMFCGAAEAALLPLFVAAKEFRYLCGYATNVNIVGHGPLRNPDLDWFARSIRRHAREAGLL